MGIQASSLALKTKATTAKLVLGVATFAVIGIIGSSTMAGATPVPGTAEANGTATTSQEANLGEKNSDKSQKNADQKDNDHGKKLGHDKNKGGHGYGGDNNAIKTDVKINQSGHDNVLTVIFNYIFG